MDGSVEQLTLWLGGKAQRPGSWMEPWIYESIYEFHSEPGWAVPVDVSTPLKTHMNLDFLMHLICGYPDQELVGQSPNLK